MSSLSKLASFFVPLQTDKIRKEIGKSASKGYHQFKSQYIILITIVSLFLISNLFVYCRVMSVNPSEHNPNF